MLLWDGVNRREALPMTDCDYSDCSRCSRAKGRG